jgi:hypothetical protein
MPLFLGERTYETRERAMMIKKIAVAQTAALITSSPLA